MKIFHLALVGALVSLGFVAGSAIAADRSPTEAELKRFVTSYRVGESTRYTSKLAVKAVKDAPPEKQKFVQCISEQMTPEAAEAIALYHARAQFSSAERLAELTAFFESAAGKKILDQMMLSFERALATGEPARGGFVPDASAFTQHELEQSNRVRQGAAFQDMLRFAQSMKSDAAKENVAPIVLNMRRACRGDAGASETREPPASPALAEKDDPNRMQATLEIHEKRAKPSPGPRENNGTVSGGEIVKRVMPAYPAEAVKNNLYGEVRLQGTVSKAGRIEKIEVRGGSHPILNEAAKAAFSQWEFKPLTRNGEPVEFIIEVPFSFQR
jgi:TonB family protein